MGAAAAIVLLLGTAGVAAAQPPLAAEVRALAARYHETRAHRVTLRPALAQAVQTDPHVDNLLALAQIGLRVGLARTLITRGRIPPARRELQTVLDEKAPSSVADWTLKDSRAARLLLHSLPAPS